MERDKDRLSSAESQAWLRAKEKHTVTINKNDPTLEIYVSLADKGLIKRLTSLDHPDSSAVSFISIDEDRT